MNFAIPMLHCTGMAGHRRELGEGHEIRAGSARDDGRNLKFIKGLCRIGDKYVEGQVIWMYAEDFCGGIYVSSPHVRVETKSQLEWGGDKSFRWESITQENFENLPAADDEFAAYRAEFGENRGVDSFMYYQLALSLAERMVKERTMSAIGSSRLGEFEAMQRFADAFAEVSGTRTAPVSFGAYTLRGACELVIRRGRQEFVHTRVERLQPFLNPNSLNNVQWIQLNVTGTDAWDDEDDDDWYDDELDRLLDEYGTRADVPRVEVLHGRRLTETYAPTAEMLVRYIDRYEWRNG